MEPDAATAKLLALIAESGQPPIWELEPAQARAQNDPLAEQTEHAPDDVERVEDRAVGTSAGSVPARIYWPEKRQDPAPLLVFFHGGGGVIGTIETHDSLCRTLANESRCITISVGYRLGPEHKFPAGLHDANAAFEWAALHARDFGGDPDRIAVGGDSCGGGIAAALVQMRRSGHPHPIGQLLIYPAVDASRSAAFYPSYADNAHGFFLERPLIDWFQHHYVRSEQDLEDLKLSPARNPDLAGLPPAIIVTAGFDPLRDEAAQYAERLRDAGVAVEYRCFESTIHGFASMGRFIPLALDALCFCGEELRRISSA